MNDTAVIDFVVGDNEDFGFAGAWMDRDTGLPIDFTGSTFAMAIATAAGEAAALELTTANGGIVDVDLANGAITAQFAAGALAIGAYVYDLVRIVGTARGVLAAGKLTVQQGVTP